MPHSLVNGIQIYSELHGTDSDLDDHLTRGRLPVLNITGTGGDLRVSRPQSNPLNKSFQVLHYDQRGLGQTDKPETRYEMADYADDAAALIKSNGWEKCHVVGTSFGGMVAQHLAIRHPERVARLVLLCTSPGGSKPSFPLHLIEDLDVESRIEMMLGLFDSRWNPGADEPIPGLPAAVYDGYIELSRKELLPEVQAGRVRQLDARSRHDTEQRLKEITAPTLVVAGEWDDLAPPRNSIAIAEAIPNAELRLFDGGHLLTLQNRTVFPTIIDFLNDELAPNLS